jgi:hypothetical protein
VIERTRWWRLPPRIAAWLAVVLVLEASCPCRAEYPGDWEVTPASARALERGLGWLAANQGPNGDWEVDDLGLVGLGSLAFLAAGHTTARGPYGAAAERALAAIVAAAKPSGLLNVAGPQRDLYNHGLATFVLTQAYGMSPDPRIGRALRPAVALIAATQCDDGGWDYRAARQAHGHDLSLAVMQAKALRGAADCGLEVPPETIRRALANVRAHYRTRSGAAVEGADANSARRGEPGQFTYDGQKASVAMAACGVVCLYEFGAVDDWRIARNLDVIRGAVAAVDTSPDEGRLPLDAYTLYYVAQALYQAGGRDWREGYPRLRDALVAGQFALPGDARHDGQWRDETRVGGKGGELYATAVGCLVLALPNRYLPVLHLQERDASEVRAAGPGRGAARP